MHDSSAPCCFVHHPSFSSELDEFVQKHGTQNASTEEPIEAIQKLLLKHFYQKNIQFTPKHIGLAQGFSGFTVYWIRLIIPNSNLSRTQYPKAYFYKSDGQICFLSLDSHIADYDDSKLRRTALKRLHEMIEVLKTH